AVLGETAKALADRATAVSLVKAPPATVQASDRVRPVIDRPVATHDRRIARANAIQNSPIDRPSKATARRTVPSARETGRKTARNGRKRARRIAPTGRKTG